MQYRDREKNSSRAEVRVNNSVDVGIASGRKLHLKRDGMQETRSHVS